jgi:hypothetical protein
MIIRQMVEARKRSIGRRLDATQVVSGFGGPMMSASNIKYEIAERTRAITYGGIGVIHKLAHESGLVDAIDRKVNLLKLYLPYHESDHVLNIAYNALCEGRCLEDIELRRNDETFLDALGAQRIPDPTTAGDFCRRFTTPFDIDGLNDAIDEARLNVWARQPDSFFEQATIDMDGHVLETTGQCKEGMDVAYNGKWGYHPLIVSLAETGEVLAIKNRPGNRPSEEGAAPIIERYIGLCRRAGFRRIVLRGDTKFSQTQYLDGWDQDGVTFYFGYVAKSKLTGIADNLKKGHWRKLKRPAKYNVKTTRRQRRDNEKEEVVKQREYENQILQYEEFAEFRYQPRACSKSYRMVVVRKHIRVEKGQHWLFDKSAYLFYITNDWDSSASDIAFTCNGRCNQENLIEQLANGIRVMHAPVDNLLSNWAYMVMTALAWNLKAWLALSLPEKGRWASKHRAEKYELLRMEFRKFTNAMLKIPCQIIHTGRQIIYRLLNWNRWQGVFFRLTHELNC